MSKRPPSPPLSGGSLIKRSRPDDASSNTQQLVISSANDPNNKGLVRSVKRTSNLEAPIISLSGGHAGEILSCRFDGKGQNIAACSTDRCVTLWRTYSPNTNYARLLNIHKSPITDLQWSAIHPLLYTISADSTLAFSSTTTGQRTKKIRAHKGVINALDRTIASAAGGVELIVTAGDDGYVKIWESGEDATKRAVSIQEFGCPVTAVAWSADGSQVFVGDLSNDISVYDLRAGKVNENEKMRGHTDTPTSLSLSPKGDFLLSPSLSSSTIVWDVRPFAPSANRVHRVLTGAPAGFESALLRGSFSKHDHGARCALGSSDRTVTIWDVESGKIGYKLPGHKGTVMCVDFHPGEPIVLTGSKDGTMLLGEIETGFSV